MKRTYRSLIIASAILLIAAGCASPSSPSTSAPAATQAAPAATAQPAGTVSASVVVEPAKTSKLAFLVSGPVSQVNVKAGDTVKAGQPLVVLDAPALAYAVDAAKAELKSAQDNQVIQHTQRKEWNGTKFLYLSGPPELRQIADARVVEAQAALDVAQANLNQATLTAPYDGTVVSVDVTAGEMVAPQEAVVQMGDLTHLQVATTDLSEREISGVQVGQKATVQLKSFEQALTGQVTAIAPMATISNGDHVFKVTIELDQPPQALLWGMTGDVNIQAGK